MSVEVIGAEESAYTLEEMQYRQACFLLLEGRTHSEVADQLGIDRATLFRWKHRAEFQATFAAMQADVLKEARTQLVVLTQEAIKTVRRVMRDASTKGAPTELQAALAVLDRAGVEVTMKQAEGVRRIVTRMPERSAAPEGVAPAEELAANTEAVERPAVRIVRRGDG